MSDRFVDCVPKMLPPSLRHAAALLAAMENPANPPEGTHPPARIAALTKKFWGAGSLSRVPVAFVEECPANVANEIVKYANLWGKGQAGAGIEFVLSSTVADATVRITRDPDWGGGYWSYLGTDNRLVPADEPTMSLDSFTWDVADSEYMRVVPHEFGHFLGFPHEHKRQGILDLLDYWKTVDYFYSRYGWSQEDVDGQIFDPLKESELITPTVEEQASIMCYTFPARVTKSGKEIPGGKKITTLDAEYVRKLYPPVVAPPPPPPPPAGGRTVKLVGYDEGGKETGTLFLR